MCKPGCRCLPFLLHFVTAVGALALTITPQAFNWRLDLSSGPHLFASLNTKDSGTVASLIGILQNEYYRVYLDYLFAEPSEEQVTFLLAHLLEHPDLHPVIFPFHLFYFNREFNNALGPFISKYQPRHCWCYDRLLLLRGLTPVATSDQIDRLKGVFNMEDNEIISSFTRKTFLRRQKRLGPLLAAIKFLHDAIHGSRNEQLIPDWERRLEVLSWDEVRDAVSGFKNQQSWSVSHSNLNSLIAKKLRTQPMRRVLWQGKLLLCALYHPYTSMDDKYEMLEEFLTANSPKDIAPSFSESLSSAMGKQGMYLDVDNFSPLQPIMRQIAKNAPFTLHHWGGLGEHILWWQERLRILMRVQSLDILRRYEAWDFKRLIEWWSVGENFVPGILFDTGTFHPCSHSIRLYRLGTLRDWCYCAPKF